MTVDKNITVDLARIQPHRVVKIHEGDVNSVFIVLTVTNLGASVSLTGLTIKYDAVINDYLAEQDASGTVDTTNNTIRIPVTSNMTAMSGTLRVDVRMINNAEVLYTQTITMLVEKSVVEGSTYIDFSHTSIVQRLDAIEARFPVATEDIADHAVTGAKISVDDVYDALGIDEAIDEAIPDISGKMDLAGSGVPQLGNAGQAFYTSDTIGIKTSAIGVATTTKEAYTTAYANDNFFKSTSYQLQTVNYSNNLSVYNALSAKLYKDIPLGYLFLAQEQIDDGQSSTNRGLPKLAVRKGLGDCEFVTYSMVTTHDPAASGPNVITAASGTVLLNTQNNRVWVNVIDSTWIRAALYSDIPTSTSDLLNDSGFITSSSLPLIVECDLSITSSGTSTSIPCTVTNPSATFAELVTAYNQGRDIVLKATVSFESLADIDILVPLLGIISSNDTIRTFGFKIPIPDDIMSVIYQDWSSYDCFLEVGCASGTGYGAKITCHSVAIADEIGNIETLLSQV